MDPDSETRIIKAVIAGDVESFGKLAKHYYPALAAMAYSVLGDHHLAEDAAQEALARAIVNLPALKQKDRFGFWLGRICRNVAKDLAAAKSRQADTKDMQQTADSRNEDIDRPVVRKAIESLNATDKELIVMRYYNRFSYERMGAVLGISTAAINGRLARVKRKIAKYLQRNGFLEK